MRNVIFTFLRTLFIDILDRSSYNFPDVLDFLRKMFERIKSNLSPAFVIDPLRNEAKEAIAGIVHLCYFDISMQQSTSLADEECP